MNTLLSKNTSTLLQPTKDELKNGWTPEDLTEYVIERKISQAEENTLKAMEVPIKHETVKEFNPHGW